MIKVNFELCHEDAICPYRAHSGDIGYDVFPAFDDDYIEIKPGETKLVPTGLKTSFPDTYGVILFSKENLLSRGIQTLPKVIGSNYKLEWVVPLKNRSNKPLVIAKYPDDFNKKELTVYDYNNVISQFLITNSYNIYPEIVDTVE